MPQSNELSGQKQCHLDINTDMDRIAPIAHALSSPLRLQIIELVGHRTMSVNELAEALDSPVSTVSLNVSVLEKAGLMFAETQPGARGTLKLCSRMTDMIYVNLVASNERPRNTRSFTMPIGCYSQAVGIHKTCGLAGPSGVIGVEDNPYTFFAVERFGAQLIWFKQGYLEYILPTLPFKCVALESLEISFEACSEAMNYRNEWESDIFLAVNGHELGVWVSPGDFGGRRGILNPDWWSDISTQYGQLKIWRVDDLGTYLDNEQVSGVTLDDLCLNASDHFTLQIGVHANAEHVGGMNLFGEKFGDHQQHIVFRYAYH